MEKAKPKNPKLRLRVRMLISTNWVVKSSEVKSHFILSSKTNKSNKGINPHYASFHTPKEYYYYYYYY